jgi:hypothetical protein
VPTRKQRRRHAKERRHEYEYVYVDPDGNEVEGDEDDERDAKPAKATPAKSQGSGKKPGTAQRSRQAGARNARKIDPPSWQRVGRRAAIFAPVMLLVIYFLKPKNASAASLLLQLIVLLALFLPFSYYMDTLMYRNYRKRIGDPLPPRERKPREPKSPKT